ncbi:unnamed protein product [Adineta ricciae]|uniref:RRM domain-containing protein n=2 Tax=Adineta ricciae TaxID=249248 RepID=A0A813MPN9_ADIRI|nr:unnamed protein product [Adineta ricciae]
MGRSRDREGSLASTGSGRTARSKKWDGNAGHRLHLSDLPVGVSKHEIEKIFRPYGELNEIWVASNPPCFAFINFTHRSDGERAMKELDGTTLAGARIGLSWARPRHYGGRSRRQTEILTVVVVAATHAVDDYWMKMIDSHSLAEKEQRSRSRSPHYRRSGDSRRRRSPRSGSQSPSRSPRRDPRRDDRQKTSRREENRRRRHSSSQSDHNSNRSPRRENKRQSTRSPSNERRRSATPNGDHHAVETDGNHAAELEVDEQD